MQSQEGISEHHDTSFTHHFLVSNDIRCSGIAKLGSEHPHVALTLHRWAMLYVDQERYTEAKSLFQRALAIREQVLGAEDLEVATIAENYATLFHQLGREEVAVLQTRAQAIHAKHE